MDFLQLFGSTTQLAKLGQHADPLKSVLFIFIDSKFYYKSDESIEEMDSNTLRFFFPQS